MKQDSKRLTLLWSASLLAASPAMAQQPPPIPADKPSVASHGDATATGWHSSGAHSATANALTKQPQLGVVVERISEELRYQLPAIKPGAGLIVRELIPDGPAARAHVEKMDILLMWNDQILVHPAQLQVLVQSSHPGAQVDLEFLHHGTLTKVQVVLAERVEPAASEAGPHHRPGGAGLTPEAMLGGALGNNLIQQASAALAGSGIDPNAVAGLLRGVDLGKLDPAALLGGKAMLIGPDGSRKEINFNDILKSNGNLGELIKSLDLGKIDPASLPGSKIVFVGPDGTQKEINLADLMQSGAALNELLKGPGRPATP
jgi:hypothetical protein